ncbi:sulfotransferase family protein [Xanthomonas sacchari]|uniref:sulfotransferase family protein n=1 Tax=Xanthomonas sacchari TaxID=56458 RepID=UPI000262A7B3|nr:sulfotransferase [Xanthomonas sacchari]MDV0440709.1 sulfotransferase [Xanthomonas sacchari]
MVKAPNLFVIGAPRCGTTSLFAALKQHPDVYATVLKEPHFYAADLPAQPHTVSDPADYQRLFAAAGDQRYRAEASVWYFYSQEAPARIARAHPDARIVLLLRSPADMLLSLYALYLRTGNEADSNPEAAVFRTSEARFANTYFPFGLHYLNLLDVTGPLSRWRSFFPRERLRVLTYEDMYASPQAGFRDLCGWLGIDQEAPVSFDARQAREAVRRMATKQLRDLPDHLRRKLNPAASRLHAGKADVAIPAALRTRLRHHAQERNAGFALAADRPWPDAWRAA